MEAITWIDRITDESNPWLTATKKEEEDDLPQATRLYLKDAGECLKQNAVVKAALSCSCAADCLERMGQSDKARLLYLEAANLYLENADLAMGRSVRESLWSLREAHGYFLLAENKLESRRIYARLARLASRVDPYVRSEGLIEASLARTPVVSGQNIKETIPPRNSADIMISLEQFLRLRRSRNRLEVNLKPSKAAAAPQRRGPVNEESIVSQLG